MFYVEAGGTSAVASTPQSKSMARDRIVDVFASIFDSAYASTRRSSASVGNSTSVVAASSKRHERLADMLAESDRREALQGNARGKWEQTPSRADQLRSAAGDTARPKGLAEKTSSLREQSLREEVQERGLSDANKDSSGDTNMTTATHSLSGQAQAGSAQAQEKSTGVCGEGSGQQLQAMSTGDHTSGAQPAPDSAAIGPASQPTSSANQVNVTSPGSNSSNHTLPGGQMGKDADSSGLFQRAVQVGDQKVGDLTGRTGGLAIDFQSVLGTAGRPRVQAVMFRSTPESLLAGKNSMPDGINLKETGAIKELAQIVRSNVGLQYSTMVLQLEPPELGQLRIDIHMRDQVLTLRFRAETEVGREILQERLNDLRSALEQHGIQLNQVEVEFRSPSVPASDGHENGSQQQPQDGGAAFNGSSGPQDDGEHNKSFGRTSEAPETIAELNWDGFKEEDRYGVIAGPAETGVDLIA